MNLHDTTTTMSAKPALSAPPAPMPIGSLIPGNPVRPWNALRSNRTNRAAGRG